MKVALDENSTLPVIEALRDRLLEALQTDTAVEVDATALSQADLCLAQLLVSARLQAANSGSDLRLATPPSAVLGDLATRAGLIDAGDPADRPFWLGEGA